jgi:hypothetical protein
VMRALLSSVFLVGCFADLRMGGSSPVGHGHGGAGPDLGIAFGAEHRGERIRAGGGLQLGARVSEENGFIPLGPMGRIDVGLTEPNQRGGRLLATGQLSLGIGRGFSGTDAPAPSDGAYAQAFIGIGIGRTSWNEPRKLEASHVAIGLLATRFAPEQGDGYWLIGAALSFSFGINVDEVTNALGGDDE